ncbi:MAG: imidazolonepropionase [Phycisphaeraceae bacterium]|nr:imidazolonepropionase [Phycisphaeraceae bacterium]
MSILFRNVRAVTLAAGSTPRRLGELGAGSVRDGVDVLVEAARISRVESGVRAPSASRIIEGRGRVLMPGFVDCHTHACWAGDRLDEWEMKRAGASYLDILGAGGGIMSTVRSVRRASEPDLATNLTHRLAVMAREGTTTVEVKSGYGLTTEHELKMLRAITSAGTAWKGTVVPTALLGHAIDADVPNFAERVVYETLPAVSAAFPGISVDAYCEKGAWSVEEALRLFEQARSMGHPIRVHADQFNALGMVPAAVGLGAVSVDHLEAAKEQDLATLAASQTFGVALPVCGFHLDARYAPARRFVEMGGAIAIATNCNPGSAPSSSMPLVIALAVRHLGLSVIEAIAAATVNPAAMLGLEDRGTIESGKRADLILLRHTDERALAYEIGGNPVDVTVIAGEVVHGGNEVTPST